MAKPSSAAAKAITELAGCGGPANPSSRPSVPWVCAALDRILQMHGLAHPRTRIESEDIALLPVVGHPLALSPLDGLRPEVELPPEQVIYRLQLIRRADAFGGGHCQRQVPPPLRVVKVTGTTECGLC